MKTKNTTRLVLPALVAFTLVFAATGCSRYQTTAKTRPVTADPLAIVLAPHEGTGKLDSEIRRAQDQARTGKNAAIALERLGWLFAAKARVSFDPGYYKLAEQCALGLEAKTPHQPEALLLRGHALQNLHRFNEAEPLACELVEKRGRAFDYGLLGDVLMEQGRLNEAVAAYQKMADLKPDLHAYTRAAHVRWLKGDLTGAIEMMQLAIGAASSRDSDTAAWVCSRMALYQLQAGNFEATAQHCAAALEFRVDYAPALFVQGRLSLARGNYTEAAALLCRAATLNPVPEYQWAAMEACHQAGLNSQPNESLLKSCGAITDPRTYALYLATCGADRMRAVRLAKDELNTRADVFTHDAVAWALAAAGQWEEAGVEMRRALAEGTRDARLFLHAGIIAAETARLEEAKKWLREAISLNQMLLPSERTKLTEYAARENIPFSRSLSDAKNLKIEKTNKPRKEGVS